MTQFFHFTPLNTKERVFCVSEEGKLLPIRPVTRSLVLRVCVAFVVGFLFLSGLVKMPPLCV